MIDKDLDTIQRNIWARINDEINVRDIRITVGDAYCLGSVIKEVLHPQIKALILKSLPKEWKLDLSTSAGVYKPSQTVAHPIEYWNGRNDCLLEIRGIYS